MSDWNFIRDFSCIVVATLSVQEWNKNVEYKKNIQVSLAKLNLPFYNFKLGRFAAEQV